MAKELGPCVFPTTTLGQALEQLRTGDLGANVPLIQQYTREPSHARVAQIARTAFTSRLPPLLTLPPTSLPPLP